MCRERRKENKFMGLKFIRDFFLFWEGYLSNMFTKLNNFCNLGKLLSTPLRSELTIQPSPLSWEYMDLLLNHSFDQKTLKNNKIDFFHKKCNLLKTYFLKILFQSYLVLLRTISLIYKLFTFITVLILIKYVFIKYFIVEI